MKIKKHFLRFIIIFEILTFFAVSGWGAIDTCPGNIVSNLDGTTTSATASISTTIPGHTTHYYHFTPSTDGTIQVNSHMSRSNRNSLFIKDGCSSTLWSDTSNSRNKYSSAINVLAGQQIVIAYKRRRSSSKSYTLDFTFTYLPQVPPIMGNIPDQIANVDTAFSLKLSDYVTPTNGDAILSYTLTGTLPSGLSFDSSIGILSGTPTTTTSAITFSARAIDNDGLSNSKSFTLTVEPKIVATGDFRDFTKRTSFFVQGKMVSIGNTFTVAPYDDNWRADCDAYTNGTYVDPITSNNAARRYCHYNVDGIQGSAATMALLSIPSDSTIKWAGLYWQALTPHRTSSYDTMSIKIRNDANGTAYHTVPVTHVDYQSNYTTSLTPVGSSSGATSGDLYSAFADVTSLFQNQGWLNGNYTVSTPDVMEGQESIFGVYGAWNLVVIYENSAETYKSFTIFDGWKKVSNDAGYKNVTVTVSGFYTPKSTPINSRVAVFAAEGDYDIDDDKLKAIRQSDGGTVEFLNSNNPNKTNQTFSSFINTTGNREPSQTNNNGIDIQTFDIGTGTTFNLLHTQQTSMEFHFTSNQDLYFPSVIAFSTDIYMPKICYDYTYGQNAAFLTAPNEINASIDGTFNKNTPIDVKLYFQNQENSDITISNLKVNIDPIDIQKAAYLPDSVYVTPPGGTKIHVNDSNIDAVSPSYIQGIPIGYFGSLDYFYTYYSLDANTSDISDMRINATLEYNLAVDVGGSTIDLGTQTSSIQSMSMCKSNVPYEPTPGIFNVVQAGETKSANPFYYFNIPTQVVNRVGNFKLESMDPDDLNKSKAVNQATDVNISMVNMAGFHYTDATCTDPDNSIAIGTPVNTHFDSNDTIVSISKNAMRTAAIFSKASQNAAFRIIYKDENNSIKTICSRDNFAIRPESYLFQFTDYNHSNPAQKSFIIDNNASIIKTADLAAGYNYLFSIHATDHLNNVPVPGYNTSNVDANMTWKETVPLNCNNENNITLSPAFMNGVTDLNITGNDIGQYNLSVQDTLWTGVDSDPSNMQHHVSPYFKGGIDCLAAASTVQPESSSSYNGCNISSVHHNTENSQYFQDMLVFYHPYKFDLNATNGGNPITPSIGPSFTPVPNVTPYIYMSGINNSQDENMSYHLNGSIVALGEDNSTLSNFVDQCYAVPLDINISTSNRDLNDSNGNHVDYRVRFHDINSTGSIINALDINSTEINSTQQANDILIPTVQNDFQKNQNGKMETRLNLNYDRKKDTTVNPATITFKKYKVNCTNANVDCTFNADLVNNKTTKGVKDLNTTILHYYGRSHAPRTTIQGSDGNVSMYYEVFCNGATCNKALLQDGNNSTSTDDPRWFVNTKHTNNFGTAAQSATVQKNVTVPKVTVTREANGNHPDHIGLHYNGTRGYPYKTTMQNNASGWLIYNKYNANALTNEFDVEFINPNTNWAGVHETNTTTNKNASDKTNRRLMW